MAKEKPILFQPEMMRANLAGIKTQTRRIIKGVDGKNWLAGANNHVVHCVDLCPYGNPGDRLWVRETVRAEELSNGLDGVRYLADGSFLPIENTETAADRWIELNYYGRKRGATVPSIHMPQWCSRMTLEITGVRVEQLQAISEEDAIAEGMERYEGSLYWFDVLTEEAKHITARDAYAALIDAINRPGTWASNPWVWVIDYKIIEVRR